MSGVSTAFAEQHRRKRVRKGTRSCWECKRRKIRCDFLESDSTCVGCLDRGTKCLSQEYVDDQAPPSGTQLGQRMGRVEVLLEKLMEKMDSSGTGIGRGDSITSEPRESLGIDVLTPSSTTSNQYENAPILTLFDNAVFGRGAGDGPPGRNDSAMDAATAISSPQASTLRTQTRSKLERPRRTLSALLLSQYDTDLLSNESHGWWLIRRHILPELVRLPDHDFSKPFSVQVVSQSHPIIICRLLLCIALCIQQLPITFDPSKLQFSGSLENLMEKYVTTVATVTSDDELIGTMEGIECLILQGVFQLNAGNIRRSWLCFRRAIAVAQLMGLHRPSLRSNEMLDDKQVSRRHYIWFQLVKGDRYLSLILGVPSAGGQPFPFDDKAYWLTAEDIYMKQLCAIAGLVLERNQAESSHAFSTTQNIDEKLDNLAKSMPSSWWELPATAVAERTQQAATDFDRVLAHIWHYELESLVHLPFMLRAATDRRYEYSRLSCLSASRGLILRWIFMRQANMSVFACRVIEFQAFTAAITLLLGLLQPSQTIKDGEQIRQDEEDRKLVDTVEQIFEELQATSGDVVLMQSIEVLKTLQSVNLDDGSKGGSLRLTIPHFGTISVARGGSSRSTETQKAAVNMQENINFQVDPALEATHSWRNIPATQPPYPTPPLLTFTSSQFPPPLAEGRDWQYRDEDIILFDSLLDTDLEGNWNF